MRFASLSACALCILFFTRGSVGQSCQLLLTIDPSQSNFTLGGSVVKPLVTPLTPANPGVLVGLQGELSAQLPGPCPADAAAAVTALAGATLSTPPATGASIQLYPSTVELKAGYLATLLWVGIGFNASIKLPDAPSGPATTSLIVSQGYINNTSFLSPVPVELAAAGTNGTNSSAASVAAVGKQGVAVLLRDVNITMPSVYTTMLGGQLLVGVTNYVLAGTLALQLVVGCPESCGVNGRCALVSGSGVACQCECGWGGAACDIPSGYCPRYSSEAAAAQSCPTVPVAAPPAPPSGQPCPSGGGAAQCNVLLQQYNASAGACSCLPGWSGPSCDACTTDSACSTLYSASTGAQASATCSSARVYSEHTAYKAYTCTLQGTGLEDVLEPGTFAVACNTTTVEAAPSSSGVQAVVPNVNDGSFCTARELPPAPPLQVSFALKGKAANPVSCKSTLCSFQANSTQVRCQGTYCTCAAACPDIQQALDSINGQPCVVDCDPASGSCSFDIQNFYIKLVAPCTNQECLVEGYTLKSGAYSYSPGTDINPFLAAIPLMALVATAAVLSAYLVANRAYFRSGRKKEGGAGDGGGGAALPIRPVGSVSELAFAEVTSAVPQATRSLLPFRRSGAAGGASTHKAVLCGISGVARGGELVGILGPSGCGKTSLLSVLAGSVDDRGSNVRVEGAVTLDGDPLDALSAQRVAYCAQDIALLPTLTVEECIRYSALLRLPREATAAQVQATVGDVVAELGLGGVAASLVGGGSGLRGISGGERRRVAIGMELVTNPSVILLDEPTSGLDSYSALNLMTTLKLVAASGRVVMLSFHQPSPAMFSLLDQAFLLARGHCVFSGPPAAAEAHFAGIGLPCPSGTAVAEHMLRCASDPETLPLLLTSLGGGAGKPTDGGGARDSSDDAETGSMGRAVTVGEALPKLAALSDGDPPPAAPHGHRRRHLARRGLGRELSVLFWRALVDIARNPTLLLLHWALALAVGVIVGCIFFQVGLDISGAQNRAGGLFFALAFFAFTSLTTVDLLMNERKLVAREVRGGYYSPASYLLSKAVVDALLLRVVPALLYSAPFYPMMGLQTAPLNVAVFLMVLSTFAAAAGALSLAVAVGCTTAGRASLVMNLVLLLSLLVGGFFANVASVPAWIRWVHYLSIFFYGYSSLITNEAATLLLDFVVDGYEAVQNVRGTVFLEIIGVNPNALIAQIVVLDCMYAAFLLLAFGLMYLRMPRARRLRPAGRS